MDSRDPYPTLRDDTTDELTNEDGPRLDPGNDDGSLSAVAFELAVLSVLLLLPTLCRVSIERGPPEVVFALRSLNFFTPVLCLLPICPSLFLQWSRVGILLSKIGQKRRKKKLWMKRHRNAKTFHIRCFLSSLLSAHKKNAPPNLPHLRDTERPFPFLRNYLVPRIDSVSLSTAAAASLGENSRHGQ